MNNLVMIKDNDVVCDSFQVAKNFSKRHDKLIAEIRRMYQDQIGVFDPRNGGTKFFVETTHEIRRRQYPMFLMNRDGFSLLVMGFTGKKAIEWKLKYIKAFNHMEQVLLQKQTPIWQDTRSLSKQIRKKETDTIKLFVDYAKANGSTNAERYYTILTKLADKTSGIINGQRDSATLEQLNTLCMAENIIERCILDGISQQTAYRQIYQACKERLAQFTAIAFLAG